MKTICNIIKFLKERGREIAKMNHLETGEIVNNIYTIKTKNANFFIIKNKAGYIAIDAGGGDKKIAKTELNKLGIDPGKVTAVLLTHTDFDHTSALGLFASAKVYISKQEVQVIDGSTPRLFDLFNNRLKCAYATIEDDSNMEFDGLNVKPILTPGHTTGSMSYLVDSKYLFVGDALSLADGKVKLFNALFNMDDEIQKQSIAKLAKIQGVEYVFTAHYGFAKGYIV